MRTKLSQGITELAIETANTVVEASNKIHPSTQVSYESTLKYSCFSIGKKSQAQTKTNRKHSANLLLDSKCRKGKLSQGKHQSITMLWFV